MTVRNPTTSMSVGRTVRRGTPPTRRRSRLQSERIAQWLFVVPALFYVGLFFGYPIAKNVMMGSQDYTTRTFVTGEAPWVGLSNYVTVVSSNLFPAALFNTAIFTIGSIAGQFTIGFGLALFFKRRFPLGGLLRSLLILPWLLPLIATSAIWKWILDQDSGVLNQVLMTLHIISSPVPWLSSPTQALTSVILVNIWLGIPFNVAILYGGLQAIPDELYEAAALDGATGFKALLYITWPRLRPVVSVVLVLGVVYTLKVIDIILGLTGGGPANATQTLATYSYQQSFELFSFGTGAAISNILIIISLAFTFVYLRLSRRPIDE
jgi:multiple sugar transport system permease protein